MKKIVGVPVTISVEGGLITDVKGNEAILDPKAPGAAIVTTFFSDPAVTERFAYCVTTGNPGARLEPDATWPVDAKVNFRKLMTIELPTNASVKGIKDGLATIASSTGSARR